MGKGGKGGPGREEREHISSSLLLLLPLEEGPESLLHKGSEMGGRNRSTDSIYLSVKKKEERRREGENNSVMREIRLARGLSETPFVVLSPACFYIFK